MISVSDILAVLFVDLLPGFRYDRLAQGGSTFSTKLSVYLENG